MSHDRKIIYLAGFLFSVPVALMSYINSIFLSLFVSPKLVGVIYISGSLLAILMLILAPKIFRKIGGHKFLLLIVGLNALSILLFAFSKNALSAAAAFSLGFALDILIIFSLDELLKIFSKNSATGKIRGIYLTVCSLAWVVALFISGTFLGGFSFKTIYLVAFVIMVSFFFLSLLGLKNIPDPKYDNLKAIKYLEDFLKNKNLLCAYYLNLLLQFFYCWMVIYTPIYLYEYLGFSWKEIGLIFTVMLLPFVLTELPLGEYSDKIGERKILMFGFFIAGVATLSLFFIHLHKIWIWALLLFTTRIGAATIEVMSDVYFFKHIKPENEEFIGIFRSASPIAYIAGPIVAVLVFIFVPHFNYIFPILGALMLSGVYLSSTIKKGDI